ncbi:MAG: response regulator [Gammaproteobacteria bacterium]|nr:response regulator [Gammaproteobacteria bacterium]
MPSIEAEEAKVLMVDDTPANIDVLRRVLAPEGYKLSFANSGKKALNLATRALPDLILLDIMMPDMDGYETCRRLKKQEATRDIPVIFITAKTETENLVEGFQVGAADYITKPFKQEEVCVRVRTQIQTQTLMKQRNSLIAELRATEERFRLLAAWSPIGIFQADIRGRTIYTNQQWQSIFGIDEKRSLKEDWLESVYIDDRNRIQALWNTGLQSRKGFASTFRIHSPKEKLRWVEIGATAIFSDAREPHGFVGTVKDITDAKLAEEKIIRAKNEAESEVQAKSAFLTGMSHELRTPLNAIIGYSQMLSQEAEDNQDSEDLEKITSASKYLLTLINNVLDLSKVETHKMPLCLEEFKVMPMLHDIAATMAPMVEKNNNTFMMKRDKKIDVMFADETKVRQVLLNLISNACKFTKDGTISLRISQEQDKGANWVNFSLSDTGIGLSEEQMERLFQKDSPAANTTVRNYSGTGLGLVLSRQFCHMMGGDILIKSKKGKGSTFTARLPERVFETTKNAKNAKNAKN